MRGRAVGADSGPKLAFPTAPQDRLSVASWPFRAYLESPFNHDRDETKPGMDVVGFAKRMQREYGIHNIEPLNRHFGATEADYLRQLRKDLKAVGTGIVNIPVDVLGSLYDTDQTARLHAVERRREWIDAAEIVGAPSIRVNDPAAPNSKPDVDRAAESLRSLAAYGAQHGVVVNLENDDLVSEDAFFQAKVIDAVNSPYLRALPDFCNSMLAGDEKFQYEAVAAMAKRAWNISHVKESELGDNGKMFRIDIWKTFGILKSAGFRGFYSMEWEGEGDPFEGTRELVAKSLKFLGG
jgi:sugar phosphate isomerase/epimerase